MMPSVQSKLTPAEVKRAEVKQAEVKQAWVKRSRWMLPLVILIGSAVVLVIKLQQHTSSPANFQVSQRGREFRLGMLNVKQDDIVHIVNDDGDLSHHAYVASERFRFDSGDQEPDGRADITFTVAGTFNVLCGIHPKMRLVVNVH